MKYEVKLETTVEAANAEAAEHTILGALAGCACDLEMKVVPAKQWYVDVQGTATYTFGVKVNAESAEDAEKKAVELVDLEARYGNGIGGALDLTEDDYDFELADLDITVNYVEPVEDEEEAEPAQPATATESSAA